MTGVSGFDLLGGNDEFLMTFDIFGKYFTGYKIAFTEDKVFAFDVTTGNSRTLCSFNKETKKKLTEVGVTSSNSHIYNLAGSLIGYRDYNAQATLKLYTHNGAFVKDIVTQGEIFTVVDDGSFFWVHYGSRNGVQHFLDKYNGSGDILAKFTLPVGNVAGVPRFGCVDESFVYLSQYLDVLKINKTSGQVTKLSLDSSRVINPICILGNYLFGYDEVAGITYQINKTNMSVVAKHTVGLLLGQSEKDMYFMTQNVLDCELTQSQSHTSLQISNLIARNESIHEDIRTSSLWKITGNTLSIDLLDNSGVPILYHVDSDGFLLKTIDGGGEV